MPSTPPTHLKKWIGKKTSGGGTGSGAYRTGAYSWSRNICIISANWMGVVLVLCKTLARVAVLIHRGWP